MAQSPLGSLEGQLNRVCEQRQVGKGLYLKWDLNQNITMATAERP